MDRGRRWIEGGSERDRDERNEKGGDEEKREQNDACDSLFLQGVLLRGV